jgi:putative PIN family toxin of toxin-antitoxin system
MEVIMGFVTLVNPTLKVNVVKDDPDDNCIIECAIESNSDYIITYDKHLLNLK